MRRFEIHQSVRSTRRGFTIVELMMVVGILLFLIAASAVVVRNIGNTAREKATIATITKVNGLLTERIESMRKALNSTKNNDQLSQLVVQKYNTLRARSDIKGKASAISRPVVEIMVMKDIFRDNFPQMGGESPSIDAAMGPNAGKITGSADGGISNSSEYLYHVLTQHDIYGVSPVGEDNFSPSEIADTDADGLKEFVDGWGKPLRFYRWPTRLIKPDGSTVTNASRRAARALISSLPPAPSSGLNEADPLNIDPDDPLNRILHDDNRLGGLLAPLFNTTTGFPAAYTLPEYATPATYSIPLVVSAGVDDALGLYEPFDATRNGVLCQPWNDSDTDGALPATPRSEYLFDNITNHNQRAGGR
jgi:prepilin-type N-terminal cleavage/methylation domain-containing protein